MMEINEKNTSAAAEKEETSGADQQAEVKDEQLQKIIGHKKRKMPKWLKLLIVLIIAGLIVGVIVYRVREQQNAPMSLQTVTAEKGDIEQTINTSGTVESENEKVYFADASAQVASIDLEKGDTVSAGQMLLTYDTDELELAKEKADLTAQASDYTLAEQLELSNKNVSDFLTSSLSLSSNDAKIADLEGKLNTLHCMEASNTKWMNDTGAQYQKDISALETEKASISNNQARIDAINTEIDDKQDEINDHDNTGLSEYIRIGEDQLSKLQTAKAEDKSKKDTAEDGIITDTKKSEIETNKQLDALSKKEAEDNLSKAAVGVTAEFDGIVKDVKAVQGMAVAPGTELFTIDDTDHVKVSMQVSKYDLDNIKTGQQADLTIADRKYSGTVSKVNHVAEKNESGASVVTAEISVTNPDSDIYIGVEAKCVIHVDSAKQVIILPVEAVNADKNGSYCYVIKDGVVKKQVVETGLTSDTYVEVRKGLNTGDQVITDTSVTLVEGMKAAAAPDETESMMDLSSEADTESVSSD